MQTATTISASEQSLIDQAFTRASGAERIEGNRVRLLRDAAENYPAWLDAIAAAERYVYFECYIIRDDASGKLLADALAGRAHGGTGANCARRASRCAASTRFASRARWAGCAGTTGRAWWSTA